MASSLDSSGGTVVKKYGAGTTFAIAATVLIWSTTFAALSSALDHFSPTHLLFLRWTLTAVMFAVTGAIMRVGLPKLRDVPRIIVAGLLGFGIYQLALVFGQTGVSASVAGFLINMAPVFTVVISVLMGRERSTVATWAGLAVAMAGVALLGLGQHGGFGSIGPSALLVIFSALCFAVYSIIAKPLFKRYQPMQVSVYTLIAGVAPFLVFAPGSLGELATASATDVATLVFLALLPGGVAYVLWSRVIARLEPGAAARFLYLVPVLGVPVAWVWVGEVPSVLTMIGGLVTIAGVAIAGIKLKPRVASAKTAEPVVPLPVPEAA